jgi:hypothetical protein
MLTGISAATMRLLHWALVHSASIPTFGKRQPLSRNTGAVDCDRHSKAERRAPVPQLAQPLRLARIDAAAIAGIHLIALLAFVPWFFSWTGLALTFLGLYVFGSLGISLCYHRLLTHRSLACPKWLPAYQPIRPLLGVDGPAGEAGGACGSAA